MNNAEWLLKQGIKFSDLTFHADTTWSYIVKDSKTGAKIGIIYTNTEFNNAADKLAGWLDEKYIKNILTVDENAYLSAVIKPFRSDVTSIGKYRALNSTVEHIKINMLGNNGASLPFYEGGTMYKGMKAFKNYTLEELGL